MTLLSICQNIANNNGFPEPAEIISSNDITIKKLLRAVNDAGKALAYGLIPGLSGRHDWQVLTKTTTFTTSSGIATYAISTAISDGDYDRLVPGTWWNSTTSNELRARNEQEMALFTNGLTNSLSINPSFTIRGSNFVIDPTPTATETIALTYVSKNWCESSGGTDQSAFAADTDVGILDEHLIEKDAEWRFLNKIGEPYFEDKMQAEMLIIAAMSGDKPSAKISPPNKVNRFIPNIPNELPSS